MPRVALVDPAGPRVRIEIACELRVSLEREPREPGQHPRQAGVRELLRGGDEVAAEHAVLVEKLNRSRPPRPGPVRARRGGRAPRPARSACKVAAMALLEELRGIVQVGVRKRLGNDISRKATALRMQLGGGRKFCTMSVLGQTLEVELADVDFRFTPQSRHPAGGLRCPFRANSRHRTDPFNRAILMGGVE